MSWEGYLLPAVAEYWSILIGIVTAWDRISLLLHRSIWLISHIFPNNRNSTDECIAKCCLIIHQKPLLVWTADQTLFGWTIKSAAIITVSLYLPSKSIYYYILKTLERLCNATSEVLLLTITSLGLIPYRPAAICSDLRPITLSCQPNKIVLSSPARIRDLTYWLGQVPL